MTRKSACWLRELLRLGAVYIPIINSLFSFGLKVHISALKKLMFVWFFSLTPIIFLVLVSPIPDGDGDSFVKFLDKVVGYFSFQAQYLYVASFVPPVFYVFIDRLSVVRKNAADVDLDTLGKLRKSLRITFRGYGLVAFLAIITLCLSIASYVSYAVGPEAFPHTFLSLLGDFMSPYLYIFSLLCLYLAFADGYVDEPDDMLDWGPSLNEMSADFGRRVSGRNYE